jgi:hypothetical protein
MHNQRLLAARADHARPPCFQNGVLVRGRALVVLLAPDKVPDCCNEEESSKYNRGVVHELGGNWDGRWHGEERDGEGRPCCQLLVEERHTCTTGRPTQGNDVAEGTKRTEVESTLFDVRAAADKGDEDRDSITQSEADDTDTGEGVEGNGGSKVNQSKDQLNSHAEHHSIQGYIQLDVNDPPPLEARNSAVTGESPGGARSSSGAADTTDEAEYQKRDEQTNRGARAANR